MVPRLLLVVPHPELVEPIERAMVDVAAHVHLLTSGGNAVPELVAALDPDVVLVHLDMLGEALLAPAGGEAVDAALPPVVVLAPPHREAEALGIVNRGALAVLPLVPTEEDLLAVIRRAMVVRRLLRAGGVHPPRWVGAPREQPRLDGALGEVLDGLYMAWQPIVDAWTAQVLGYEALVRSTAPRAPSAWHVLDVARRARGLDALHTRIVQRVAEDVAAGGLEGLITVNVTLEHLLDGRHLRKGDPLRPHAERIVLEVCEEGRVDDVRALAGAVQALRDCGYRIAVDDLGAGEDHLARMVALVPDIYKLDRLALTDLERDPRKRHYVRTIVETAHTEGALVVGEGIEQPEDARLAAELGCDLFQGYLFGRPERRAHWIERAAVEAKGGLCGPRAPAAASAR